MGNKTTRLPTPMHTSSPQSAHISCGPLPYRPIPPVSHRSYPPQIIVFHLCLPCWLVRRGSSTKRRGPLRLVDFLLSTTSSLAPMLRQQSTDGTRHCHDSHDISTEHADSNHERPARDVGKAIHDVSQWHQQPILSNPSIERMQGTLINRLLLVCLVGMDLNNIPSRSGGSVQANDADGGSWL